MNSLINESLLYKKFKSGGEIVCDRTENNIKWHLLNRFLLNKCVLIEYKFFFNRQFTCTNLEFTYFKQIVYWDTRTHKQVGSGYNYLECLQIALGCLDNWIWFPNQDNIALGQHGELVIRWLNHWLLVTLYNRLTLQTK